MNEKQLFAIGAGVVVGYLLVQAAKDSASDAARAVVVAVDPTNPDNLPNRAASGIVETISGGKYLSIGDWLYSVTHPNEPGGRLNPL